MKRSTMQNPVMGTLVGDDYYHTVLEIEGKGDLYCITTTMPQGNRNGQAQITIDGVLFYNITIDNTHGKYAFITELIEPNTFGAVETLETNPAGVSGTNPFINIPFSTSLKIEFLAHETDSIDYSIVYGIET